MNEDKLILSILDNNEEENPTIAPISSKDLEVGIMGTCHCSCVAMID